MSSAQSIGGVPLKPRKRKKEASDPDVKAQRLEAAQAEEQAPETAATSAEQMAEVSELLADSEAPTIVVTIDDEERAVSIYRCKARQIGYVMRFLATAFRTLGVTNFKEAEALSERLKNPTEILVVLADIMDDAIATSALLTDLDAEDFHELEVDDALAVMIAVFAVNRAFFLTRVLPMVRDLLARGGLDTDSSSSKIPSSSEKST